MSRDETKFQIGDRVRVVKLADGHGDERFVGRIGRVVDEAVCLAAGVGESDDDPFYTVAVERIGTDGFWGEELELVS
jgi:hypothetical protein